MGNMVYFPPMGLSIETTLLSLTQLKRTLVNIMLRFSSRLSDSKPLFPFNRASIIDPIFLYTEASAIW